MNKPPTYWASMPPPLRNRFAAFFAWVMLTGTLVVWGFVWAFAFLAVPVAIFAIIKLSPLLLGERALLNEPGLVSYTIDYIWARGPVVRWLVGAGVLISVVAGLVWIGSADLRAERAQPSWSERATDLSTKTKAFAKDATAATREIAGDARDTAVETGKTLGTAIKGWFD